MSDQGVVVLGIPIPSTSPVFLGIVVVHVIAGLCCSVAGIVAMLVRKGSARHRSAGTVYFRSLLVVFLTMGALSILHWPHDTYLLVLGVLSLGAGVLGRMAKRRAGLGWLRTHVTGMALSYILLLTAFYVDNGPNLPGWRSLPPLLFWLIPGAVGLPVLIRALMRHPLVVQSRAGSTAPLEN
jgi:hypothetical protein